MLKQGEKSGGAFFVTVGVWGGCVRGERKRFLGIFFEGDLAGC